MQTRSVQEATIASILEVALHIASVQFPANEIVTNFSCDFKCVCLAYKSLICKR